MRRKLVSFRRFQEYLYLVFFLLLFSNINITCIERKRGERGFLAKRNFPCTIQLPFLSYFIVLYRTSWAIVRLLFDWFVDFQHTNRIENKWIKKICIYFIWVDLYRNSCEKEKFVILSMFKGF